MIRFRQKNYTIPEGHYTGPKDTSKLPGAVELMTKGALGGAAVGGVAGALVEDSSILDGIKKGSGVGAVAGLLAKLLINYSQKPMNSIKYQEVDKAIRRRFGVYRVAGITVGDAIDKRDKIENKFSFNDRDVSSYKINIAICDNKFNLYTFGMTKQELNDTSKILDYYCKKYYGMEYDSKAINPIVNSYSVAIIFTNNQAVCDFIMELSDKLQTKINFLDSKAIILPRLESASDDLVARGTETEINTNVDTVEKTFSVTQFGPSDLLDLVLRGSVYALTRMKSNFILMDMLVSAAIKLDENERNRLGIPKTFGSLNNIYLETLLKKLHYVEKFDYSVGCGDQCASRTNVSLISGLLLITTPKDSKDNKILEDKFYKHLKRVVKQASTGKVIIYTYQTKSLDELKNIINKLMSCGIRINIYDESFGSMTRSIVSKFRRK